MKPRLIIGCMTGTSLDALDAALVRIEGVGLEMRAMLQRSASRPLEAVGAGLRRLAQDEAMPAREITALAHKFAGLHVELLRELIADEPVDFIAVHGQTVFHAPPLSWQLLNPAPIAHELKIPVVFDFRAADLACGGQGAPITPLADYILFRNAAEARTIVNLGGFCNFTALPRAADETCGPAALGCATFDVPGALRAIRGGDICVCNQLLDTLARVLFDVPFDENGRRALHGQARPAARDDLIRRLDAQAAAGRSLGTGDECGVWLERFRGQSSAADLARSACEALADVIVRHIGNTDRLILAGGGAKNQALVNAIAKYSSAKVNVSDEFGVPSDMREAMEMAVLGALCQDRVPITLPQITKLNGPAPVAGCWVYP